MIPTAEELNSKYFDFETQVRKLFNKTVDDAIAGLLERMAAPVPSSVAYSPQFINHNQPDEEDDQHDATPASIEAQTQAARRARKSNTLTMPKDAKVPAGVSMGAVGAEARSEPYEATDDDGGGGSTGITNITHV